MPPLIDSPITLPPQYGRLVTAQGTRGRDPRPVLPLQGVTLLAVEDSRFAADALRLISQRSGARLRRADTILTARSHLKVYLPDVVLVDLGLPDGRGEDLIAELALGPQRPAALLGMSGDPLLRPAALAAGADAFLDKPLPGPAAFQRLILGLLGAAAGASCGDDLDMPPPDPVALHDDLVQAAKLLARPQADLPRGYVARFVGGIARHAGDEALARSAYRARDDGGLPAVEALRRMVAARLSRATGLPEGFGNPDSQG